MPFARVGAMPLLSSTSKQNSSNGKSPRSRSRGITMEDLKKQTAIRLAQEQKQGQVASLQNASPQVRTQQRDQQHGDHLSASVVPQQPTPPPQPPQSSYHPSSNEIMIDPTIYLANQYQPSPHQHHQQMVVATTSPMMPVYTSQAPQISYMIQQDRQQQLSGGYMENGRIPHTPPALLGHYSGAHALSGYSQESQMYIGSTATACFGAVQLQAPAIQPLGASTCSDPNHISASSATKTKLPHGLTVHELKEMTKARLQAEAAEKTDAERGVVSPLDFEASGSGELRERAISRDSTARHHSVFVQPYTGTMAGEVGVVMVPDIRRGQDIHCPSIASFGGRQFPSSPLPPSLHGIGRHQYMNVPDQTMDSIGYRAPARSDTWDSTSVASYNSAAPSENMGPESVADLSAFVSGNRTRSFTYPATQPLDVNLSGVSPAARKDLPNPQPEHASRTVLPSFDAAVGGNRRRAVTLSPNTGSFLEDRPHHHGADPGGDLHIPNFSTRRGGPMVQTRQRNYSPVLEELGLAGGFGVSENGRNEYRNSNALVPLPSIPQGGTPASRGLADLSSMHGTSTFFREESDIETRVPAPPGFLGSEMNGSGSSNRHTAFSRVGRVEDVLGSVIGDGTKDQWGVHRPHLGSVGNLGDDLGYILDLSGSNRHDRERANTYTYGSNQPSSFLRNQHIADDFIDKDLDASPY